MTGKLKVKRLGQSAFTAGPIWPAAVLLAALTCLLVFPPAAAAGDDRTFHFPEVLIEAVVHGDGSMSVIERRTFDFRGIFKGAWQFISLDTGPNAYSIREITVSERGSPYRLVQPGTQGEAGTFYVEHRPGEVYIDWSFWANDERRTFTISYVVDNAVIVHRDVAELSWIFIGDQWAKRTDYARVELSLPAGAAAEEIRVWGHGPLHGAVALESPTRAVWEINRLPARRLLEGRVVFPLALVPAATNYSGQEALPGILAEEEALARRANLRRWLSRFDYILGALLLAGTVLLYLVLRRRALGDPQAFRGDYYRDLPGDYSPAEAGYLVGLGKLGPPVFTATVMDLARRGHLELKEEPAIDGRKKRRPAEYRIVPKQGGDPLLEHERQLYQFLFDRVGGGNYELGIALNDIRQFAQKSPSAVQGFYQGWNKKIELQARKHEFFRGPVVAGIVAGLILFLAGFLIVFLSEMYVTGSIALLLGMPLLIAMALLKELTPPGADHLAKWRAFKRFLLHFSEMERSAIPALQVWEHYLVYAVVLGVAKQVLRQLQLVYPQLRDEPRLAASSWTRMALANPGQFDKVTSAMQQSFRSAFHSSSSSGSGRGGGFSGGGGGGRGGGGGGAR